MSFCAKTGRLEKLDLKTGLMYTITASELLAVSQFRNHPLRRLHLKTACVAAVQTRPSHLKCSFKRGRRMQPVFSSSNQLSGDGAGDGWIFFFQRTAMVETAAEYAFECKYGVSNDSNSQQYKC